jgi:hypothetical protein
MIMVMTLPGVVFGVCQSMMAVQPQQAALPASERPYKKPVIQASSTRPIL